MDHLIIKHKVQQDNTHLQSLATCTSTIHTKSPHKVHKNKSSTMANFHLAATAPINPPGAKPVLSREQVWRALQIKVREPSLFVPVITSCAVVSEKGNVVNREVQFKSGLGLPEGKISEACTNYAPAKVHFKMDTGDEVENIVGQGPSDDENDLWLTYAFDWVIKEGADTSQHGKVSFLFCFSLVFFLLLLACT